MHIKCNIYNKNTYTEASVVVPDFDAGYSKVCRALRVPDDEVELDGRVEWARPHVTLFGGLSTPETKAISKFSASVNNDATKLSFKKCQKLL